MIETTLHKVGENSVYGGSLSFCNVEIAETYPPS